MKFTNSCFVRVEDAEKRKELIGWLSNIGYKRGWVDDSMLPFVVVRMFGDRPDFSVGFSGIGMREFGYDKTFRCFYHYVGDRSQCVYKQYLIFDYLHELKIDYRGLIDAGLAIDVNILNENPYK